MKRLLILAVLAGLPTMLAAAPAAAPGAAALDARSSVDQILDALDQRGQNLREFVADVRLTEGDDTTQLFSTRVGKVWYQARKDDPRLRITFNAKETDNRRYDEKIEYTLDGGWLLDRDYQKKIEVRRQVAKPGQKINLLKLGEGPFPLPIGQKKEEVYKQFDVKKMPVAKDDPAGTAHVQLKPKEGTSFAQRMLQMDVWVNAATHFPDKIEVVDANGTNVRTTHLTNVTVNPQPALADRDFALPQIVGGWSQHDEPFAE